MDLRRLRVGEWILGVAGVALAVSLFGPWYRSGGAELSAWQTFTVVDVLAALLAAGALVTALIVATQRSEAPGIAAEGLLSIVAVITAVVVLVRFLNVPGALEDVSGVSRGWGAWLGLASTFAILAGALTAMRDERIGDPADVPPIETLPAPPATG